MFMFCFVGFFYECQLTDNYGINLGGIFLLLLDFHKVLNSLSLEYLISMKFKLSRVWVMNSFLRKKLLDFILKFLLFVLI